MKAMDKRKVALKYVQDKCPRINETKIKEKKNDIFISPQIGKAN